MRKRIMGAAAVTLITAGIGGQAWGWGNVNTKFDFRKTDRRSYDNSMKVGGSVNQDSNNHTTTNRNDNRQWNDNRVANTSDNRDMSNHQSWSDSRNMSDNRQWHDNRRENSHDIKGDNNIMINGHYKARTGHGKVEVGGVKGDYNTIDNSINGNSFAIGHTTVKP